MNNKLVLTINKRYVNPMNDLTYAYEIDMLGVSKMYGEDELNMIRRRSDVEIIDNSKVVKMMPRGTFYLANKIGDGDNFVSVYSGDVLKEHMNNELYIKRRIEGKRDIFKKLHGHLLDENSRRVLLLHGLRRTGKTVMILQMIEQLIAEGKATADEICLMTVNSETVTMIDIYRILDEQQSRKVKYTFIDEITKVNDVLTSSQFIHDEFGGYKEKILLTGTSSLAISMLRMKSLATRCEYIPMPPVGYNEHCRLVGNIGFLEYIRHGGIFTGDFVGFENMKGYVYTSIVENISDTLLKNRVPSRLGATKEEIETIVSKVIYNTLTNITKKIINKELNTKIVAKKNLDSESNRKLEEMVNKSINISSNIKIDNNQLREVMKALSDMDVVVEVKNMTIHDGHMITRFPGLVYAFCEQFLQAGSLQQIFGYTDEESEVIEEGYRSVLEGLIIESAIASEMLSVYTDSTKHLVRTFNNNYKVEVDLAVSSVYEVPPPSWDIDVDGRFPRYREINMIEIKRRGVYTPLQVRWLVDNLTGKYTQAYNKANRIVLYMGQTEKRWIDQEVIDMKIEDEGIEVRDRGEIVRLGYDEKVKFIYYLNIEEFLLNPHYFLFQGGLEKITREVGKNTLEF